MATPKPGEIRCPTCHRSTPPAAFCTQCGSAIPSDARIRPRGMDRDELQERIRARRSGDDPYRRGAESTEGGGYARFEPDPTDAMARQAPPPDEERHDYLQERPAPQPSERRDLTRDDEDDEWRAPAATAAPVWREPEPVATGTPDDAVWSRDARSGQPEPAGAEVAYDDGADEPPYDYAYEDWEEPRRRSGGSALAILGFLGLGVLALIAGGVLASMFSPPGVGQDEPSPSIAASAAPSVAASVAATPAASAGDPSGSPAASGGPVTFPDGFTAEAQPCLPGSAGASGCQSNGAVNSGAVDIWVGFTNGNRSDVIGATVEAPDGSTADGSIDLARIGCGSSCNGYTWFSFSNLEPGTYEVRITRNGEPAGSTTFEVS